MSVRLNRFIQGPFDKVLNIAVRNRYLRLLRLLRCSSFRLALWVEDCSLSHFSQIESDRISISATLPYGAPIQNTAHVQRSIESAIDAALANLKKRTL